jgi:hypothetical protein
MSVYDSEPFRNHASSPDENNDGEWSGSRYLEVISGPTF